MFLAKKYSVTALLIIVFSFKISLAQTRYPETNNGLGKQTLKSSNQYMAATANPYASEAALKILKIGGSAIDAAIAAQMVLTLVEPEASGIGGGGFALYWDNKKQILSSYDGREKAPSAADESLFLDENKQTMNWWYALAGGRSVGVPGIIALFEKMHKKHGKLPWSLLFQDAIYLAENGFEVSPKLSQAIKDRVNPALGRYQNAWQYFWPNGQALPARSIKKNPELATTFKKIATLGAQAFYYGDIAIAMTHAVKNAHDNPGLLSLSDLSNYQAVERTPLCSAYKKYRICGMPPPTSGGITVIQILKLLEQHNLEQNKPLSTQSVHLFSQAAKLAYADRDLYIADPDFINVPTQALIDAAYLKKRSQLIGDQDMGIGKAGKPKKMLENYQKSTTLEQPSTSHFSIIDGDGNAISMTSSIEMAFGSTLMVAGFLLNNQLTDFSFQAEKNNLAVANRVQGNKRPRSSMSPFMVFDENNQLFMIIGSPGGSRIINYVAKTILAVLDWKLDIQSAINLSHYVNRNGVTELEANSAAEKLKDALIAKGHQVKITKLNSGLHGIVIKDNKYYGGADPRRVGQVLGD